MEITMTLVIMAILIQAVVEGVKQALSRWDYLALALGAALCPLAGIDIFVILGIPLVLPYVGAVLTGVIVGRGAAFVFDLWNKVKAQTQPPAQ